MKNVLFCFFIVLLVISSAKAQDFSITIDGQRDAFYDGLTNPNDGKIFMPSSCFLPEDTTKYGRPWGDADISGIIWTAWDSTYLYYYAEVTDNFIVDNNATNWQNDKIELKYRSESYIKINGAS